MAKDDKNNVVKLRQSQPKAVAGASVDDPISPKSLLNMTELEQEMLLQQLRERRMRAVEILRQAAIARQHAMSVSTALKLERKAKAAEAQLERATVAIEKLEKMIYDMRALHLQHTDIDITRAPDNVKLTTNNGDK